MENNQIKTPEEIREIFAKIKAEREAKAKVFMEKLKVRAEEIRKARENTDE